MNKHMFISKLFKLLTLALALTNFYLVAGCAEDNPNFCDQDSQCQDQTRATFDLVKPYCHATGHYCYSGCFHNADCQNSDKTNEKYEPDKPVCNLTTHHCQTKESPSGNNDSGLSGTNSDGLSKNSDAGLSNSDSGDSHKIEAGSPSDATSKLPEGAKCKDNDLCQSGFCVDGVCCRNSCEGKCSSCNQPGNLGKCTHFFLGEDPENECSGEASCGGDVCDGQGQCTETKQVGTVCKSECLNTSGQYGIKNWTCDNAAKCITPNSITTNCAPYKCAMSGANPVCGTTCGGHDDCVPESLCDRFDAHVSGAGVCVSTNKIASVGASGVGVVGAAINVVLNGDAGKTHVKVPASVFNETINIPSGTVKIVGVGDATMQPANASEVIFNVSGLGQLFLQGIKLSNAAAQGIYCQGSTYNRGKIVAVDSRLINNSGVGLESSYCDVTLRRDIISANKGGGAKLFDGAFIVESSLFQGNGTSSGLTASNFGGLFLMSASAVTFINNTVVGNVAKNTSSAGVICSDGSITLTNSILWDNSNSQYLGCSINYSDVAGGAAGAGNININPQLDANFKPQSTSPVINQGTNAGATKLDLASSARQKGNAVDIGAYEVK